jgi:hypothetical protein
MHGHSAAELKVDSLSFASTLMGWFEPVQNQQCGFGLQRFRSDGGTLTLMTHDPTKGSRRMAGTIVAKNLMPMDGAKPVDLEAFI